MMLHSGRRYTNMSITHGFNNLTTIVKWAKVYKHGNNTWLEQSDNHG